ncbi:MAG: hypothetical protein IJ861_08375, partial [Clostridia bacterium]|nr:hypothetical protein [Clostridia bacterium]
MQCKNCGSEWKTNNRAGIITSCPFCGAKLEQEKEDKLTFQNAKEALRYIVKTYGVDVIIDGLQLRTALDEFIPDLKQERKVFMDAYEAGVCNALYLAHDEPEIDKCIAILQSIKVLTQDACMAEKWACYVVETYVYALNWNVPMFGITPNIHMYQIPENINESGENGKGSPLLIQSGGVWEEQDGSDGDMWDKSSEKSSGKNGNFVLPSKKTSQLPEQTTAEEVKPESPVYDFTEEAEQAQAEEPKPESPVYDFTEEAEQTQAEEPKPESPVYDFTEEAEQTQAEEPKPESPV